MGEPLYNPDIHNARFVGIDNRQNYTTIRADYLGDYPTVAAAFMAGVKTVFLRDGLYDKSDQKVVFTAAGQHVIGESWNAHMDGGIVFHPVEMDGAQAFLDCSVSNFQVSTTAGGGSGSTPIFVSYGAQPTGFIVERMYISGSDSHGIRIAGNGNQLGGTIIRNCRIQSIDAEGISIGWSLYSEIVGNYFLGCTGHGINSDGNSDSTIVSHNQFRSNSGGDIHVYGDNGIYSGNICWHATEPIFLDTTANCNALNFNLVNAASTDNGASNVVNDVIF